jgi:heptosyltransferase family protein
VDLQNKKIWITTGGGIGDTIMFTSALRRIKEKYPSCHLTFMTRWPNHTLLRGIPYLDEVTYIRRGTPLGRWRVLPSFLGLSDFRRQDAVVFTDWQPQLLIAAKLSRIPLRAGYPRENHPLSKHLTKSISPHVMQSSAYAAETNARVFSDALGVNLDGDMSRPDVGSPTEEEHRHVSELLEQIGLKKNASFFLLSPFAGFTERNWPLEEARIFVKHAEKYFERPVVVIAPPEKEKEARELSKYNLAGQTGIVELVDIIARADLLVTPDSGPMHIAGALGTPVVPLFSKDLPSRWAPRYHCQPVYLELPCSPCSDDTARHCSLGVKCMNDIHADMVLTAAELLLQRERPNAVPPES